MLIDFFLLVFLSSKAYATHFAAGSLQFKKDENGVLWVERTMGWRRGLSGWGDGCVEADLNTLSGGIGSGHANRYLPIGITDLEDAAPLAPAISVRYILLQIEDNESLTQDQHYCYGKTFNEAIPAAITDTKTPFTMTNGFKKEGNTLSIMHDNGASQQNYYQYTAHIYTYDNNTPRFETPAIWWIMEGCSGQTYYITPVDPDGNSIKCRWSTIYEASFMAHDKTDWDGNDWPMEQLSLDEVACSVTYHPEFDNHGGNKAIAVQVEDYDENGVLLSSVPCVFFARVFTPDIDPNVLDNPFVVTNRAVDIVALEDDHHDEHEDDDVGPVIIMPRKLMKTTPAHCEGLPVWIPPTPPNESLLTYEATVAYYQVWAARFLLDGTYYTTVNRAQFSLPDGMICTELRSDGTATCTWTPTVDQIGLHSICGLCYDVFKRPSARNCVNVEVINKLPPVQDPCEEIEKVEMVRSTFSSEHIQSRTDLITVHI
jgi:hypothetical protein